MGCWYRVVIANGEGIRTIRIWSFSAAQAEAQAPKTYPGYVVMSVEED